MVLPHFPMVLPHFPMVLPHFPMVLPHFSPATQVDGWNSWNQLRLLCDQNPRLQVVGVSEVWALRKGANCSTGTGNLVVVGGD